jgi:hypothetical protein
LWRDYLFLDGQIILPERYERHPRSCGWADYPPRKDKDVKAADLAGEDDMDVEEGDDEEDDGTSKKTITPEDDD